MKMLLAYDGSPCSDAAIDDLVRAGLPSETKCLVFSVTEVWLPPQDSVAEHSDPYLETIVRGIRQKGEQRIGQARALSEKAAMRISAAFPDWKVSAEATFGSPAWEIIAKADEIAADLIVIGSHGKGAIERLVLGSVSQKVLTSADCSVRIARGKIETDPAPIRLLVGFDGSKGADVAVSGIAERVWPTNTEVILLAATEPLKPSLIGALVPPIGETVDDINEAEQRWLRQRAAEAIEKLSKTGISARFEIEIGNPKSLLTRKAEVWDADCIFVGANAFGSRLERFLLGSTSAAVAARARCSVEAARIRKDQTN
ncbi:MAG: hypothetical protein C4324_01350 [Blastocatellia bacterium]